MASKGPRKSRDVQKKCKSRDAARSRRGQQNDEFAELSHQLPLPKSISSQLDRLCIMRLTNSYIKIKRLLSTMMNQDVPNVYALNFQESSLFDKQLLQALDGFVYVIAQDGQCLYISENVTYYLGLSQIEVTGNSLYKYVHPCDHEELANQLGAGSKRVDSSDHYKSFFLRMKSTLTSRGKNVNLRASTYRVVHCTGSMKYKTIINKEGQEQKVPLFLVAIAVPLMFATTFEVPLDRGTFTSRHMLDMKFLQCDDRVSSLLGYTREEMIGKSWYSFHHAADLDNVLNTHKMLLTKGQSVSKYYRFMVRGGGWVWLQTKANVVYDSKTCQPQFVFCINYVLGGKQDSSALLATEQINPVPSALALETIIKTEEGQQPPLPLKETIVLEEQAKARKNMAKEAKSTQVKSEPSFTPCKIKEENDSRDCSCIEMDCEHMNFQEVTPVTWEDMIQQQQEYDRSTWDHYNNSRDADRGMDTPRLSPDPKDESMPSSEESTEDSKESEESEAVDESNELQNRAPYIPPPTGDAALMCDSGLLEEISFADSPLVMPSWLDGDELLHVRRVTIPQQTAQKSLSNGPSPILSRKRFLPDAIRRNGYITNDMLTGVKALFPYVTQSDAEVNAPVQSCNLLQGSDLLTALDQCDPTFM
uniref:Hypoxia inducible factor n=2 Tax=Nematostella vectensis TaxID=45351 RepID=A0A076FS22_NEMVE|nr:hypoxia inducible factor [Nematostella vectensis]